jgi:hypothetical protein
LGRRQTNAMTSRCNSRSAPPRFRWITFEMHIRSQEAASLPLLDNSSSLLAFEHNTSPLSHFVRRIFTLLRNYATGLVFALI